MTDSEKIVNIFNSGSGIIRMLPVFVPRRFSKPGKRLKLHPDDYYALGTKRGAIKERWFSSVIPAMNGDDAPADEGMSYIVSDIYPDEKFLFKDCVSILGESLIGKELMGKYGTWPMYSKFFDYEEPLFHHLHLDEESANRVGRLGKPEAYYYPYQLNNCPGNFPHTYFGFDPDVTKEQVRERLLDYENKDIRITELSRAYRIELGTGWYTPPGVLHAPGSYLTYEPQWNSDVNSVYENITAGEVYPYEFLSENCPEKQKRNVDYIMGLMDWEKNIDPHYRKNYFRPPVITESSCDDFIEKWVVYANNYIAAKELTIFPGKTVCIKDSSAYGCIFIQGHGDFGVYEAETPVMLRYGQRSSDEFFVSENSAKNGVTISNKSKCEPLVMLKHFGPNNPEVPMRLLNEK